MQWQMSYGITMSNADRRTGASWSTLKPPETGSGRLYAAENHSSSVTGNSIRYALMNPSILPSITPSTSDV